MVQLEQLLITPHHSIREVMACIHRNAKGIALVVDETNHLLGTITDGDIRGAILAGVNLDSPAQLLLQRKTDSPYQAPITAQMGTNSATLIELMQQYTIHQIPLLNESGQVVDLVTLNELLPEQILPLQAVIMAGGFGTRLRPLTEELPKPMLPVGDKPIMEWMIKQLHDVGIRQVNVTTHYMAEKIVNYFGDGQAFGVNISYVNEDQPLGTAGALGLMETPSEPLLVVNGDILTRVDFRAMLNYHHKYKADLTIGVKQYDVKVPYGVLECDGVHVKQVLEKPTYNFFVNAGIYLLQPEVHSYIPPKQRFDMTDLIQYLIQSGHTVVNFPIMEYWLDVGQHPDYQQAQQDVQKGHV